MTEIRLKLPATVDGENVSYYRQMEDRGLIVIGMVVLIGLVLIFKSQLTSLVQNIFQKITSESAGI